MNQTIDALKQTLVEGGIFAYPTEAVYGLGCLPDQESAVLRLLALKQRKVEKGLILVAANYSQLLPYVDDKKIPQEKRYQVFSHWPGPTTLILPARAETPYYLKGKHQTLAVRVTNYAPLAELCRALGSALVSTSANRQGCEPLRTYHAVKQAFGNQVDKYIDGPVAGHQSPSKILNPLNGEIIRA